MGTFDEGYEGPWSFPRMRRGFVTAELISGTVLVSVVIAVANEGDGILDVFSITVLSALVFWLIQVYVVTIAVQATRSEKDDVRLRKSLRFAIRRSNGLLLAAVPPVVFLLVGLIGPFRGQYAYWLALWIEVGVLGTLGWIAFSGRNLAWYWRVCGAVATAGFGLIAILLKILIS